MKRFRIGSLAKMVAFFLIATVLTCIVAFAANGWQSQSDEPDSGKVNGDSSDIDNPDENNDGITQEGSKEPEDIPTIDPTPQYLHYLTGTEVSQEDYFSRTLCFIMESSGPIYGIGSSLLTVEIPVEGGRTRVLAFMNKSSLPGKIGALAPTRAYISDIAGYFGGILFSNGSDDAFEYNCGYGTDAIIDFTQTDGYHYTEYNAYSYTNTDLISAVIKNSGTDTLREGEISIPYQFCEWDSSIDLSGESANSIIINYKDGNTTELYYSVENGGYCLYKNGNIVKDLISDKPLEYTNSFILYADATTYETEAATETVLNATKGGKGVYCTGGKYINIYWSVDQNGEMIFTTESGEMLTVNRGCSYISYVKSSIGNGITIS